MIYFQCMQVCTQGDVAGRSTAHIGPSCCHCYLISASVSSYAALAKRTACSFLECTPPSCRRDFVSRSLSFDSNMGTTVVSFPHLEQLFRLLAHLPPGDAALAALYRLLKATLPHVKPGALIHTVTDVVTKTPPPGYVPGGKDAESITLALLLSPVVRVQLAESPPSPTVLPSSVSPTRRPFRSAHILTTSSVHPLSSCAQALSLATQPSTMVRPSTLAPRHLTLLGKPLATL